MDAGPNTDPNTDPDIDPDALAPSCAPLAEDFRILCEAVRGAGEVARQAYEAANARVWEKEKGHPVTDADMAVNAHLEAALRRARPRYGWLSEETRDDHSRHACPRSWVVDPIDGTRAFIDRRPGFCVSVAIIQGGVAVAGAVADPLGGKSPGGKLSGGRLYAARHGAGATLDGVPIRATARTRIEGARMVGYPRKFQRQGWPPMEVTIRNSMALRMVMVASGEADATVSFTPKSDWDVAAADIIAREAGAVVSDLDGTPFRYDAASTREFGVVCAGPALHGLLLERTRGIRARVEAREDLSSLGTTPSDRA